MTRGRQFVFANGVTATIKEASSAMYDDYQDLSLDAQKGTYTDPVLEIFAKTYYPLLAACTENSPPLEVAYKFEFCEIDEWWLVVCQTNSYWLTVPEYKELPIEFSNGKKIIVKSSRPSVSLRLAVIQQELEKDTALLNAKDEVYRLTSYPGIAAASFGEVPSAYEARNELTLQESILWHKTVRELIPEWYGETDTPVSDEATEKKKDNPPAES